jgi:hypothetical protein
MTDEAPVRLVVERTENPCVECSIHFGEVYLNCALTYGGDEYQDVANAEKNHSDHALRDIERPVPIQNVVRVTKRGECVTAQRDVRLAESDSARAAFRV